MKKSNQEQAVLEQVKKDAKRPGQTQLELAAKKMSKRDRAARFQAAAEEAQRLTKQGAEMDQAAFNQTLDEMSAFREPDKRAVEYEKTGKKVPVSRQALLQRMHRVLVAAEHGETLRKARSDEARATLGDYYIVHGTDVVEDHVHIEEYCRQVGALRDWEVVKD
jgi:predicted DNA-binding protein (UPF0251 family)